MSAKVISLFKHQARASSRAAKVVKISAVKQASLARAVAKTEAHHSAGILLRWPHLVTAVTGAPTSAAMDSREGQRAMIERNEVKSVMPAFVGQTVLKDKAILSLDTGLLLGQNVPMAKTSKKPLSDYELDFLARTYAAREAKGLTQAEMAKELGDIGQDHYKQYEIRGMLPHELVDLFLEATEVSWEYLFAGRGEGPAWRERRAVLVERQRTKKKLKKAA